MVKGWVLRGYGRAQVTGSVASLGRYHPKIAQAGVPTTTDDQVVVHRYAERGGCRDDFIGHGDIRSGRGRIAGRMIVYEDEC